MSRRTTLNYAAAPAMYLGATNILGGAAGPVTIASPTANQLDGAPFYQVLFRYQALADPGTNELEIEYATQGGFVQRSVTTTNNPNFLSNRIPAGESIRVRATGALAAGGVDYTYVIPTLVESGIDDTEWALAPMQYVTGVSILAGTTSFTVTAPTEEELGGSSWYRVFFRFDDLDTGANNRELALDPGQQGSSFLVSETTVADPNVLSPPIWYEDNLDVDVINIASATYALGALNGALAYAIAVPVID